MAAYVIATISVTDPTAFERYKELASEAAAANGGRFLVRGGAVHLLEGDTAPERVTVIEFDDVEAARRWWDSPQYTAAREAREGAAVASFVIVEGV